MEEGHRGLASGGEENANLEGRGRVLVRPSGTEPLVRVMVDGHNEGYPDGPKNLFRNVYGFIAGERAGGDFSTFIDGHNEIAICDAVLKSCASENGWMWSIEQKMLNLNE